MAQWVPGTPVPEGEAFTMDLHGCARCDGPGHPVLTFHPFTRPPVVGGARQTHWATCPVTGEPIMLQVVP